MKTLVVFPNREVLYAASTLGGEVTALAVSQEELETAVGRAHKVVQLHGEPYLDAVTEVVYRMASGHDVVILPSTKNAKTVGGAVAQRIGVEFLTDVLAFSISGRVLKAERYVFGNKAVAQIETQLPAVLTIASGRFQGEPPQVESKIERVEVGAARVKKLSVEEKPRVAVKIEEAEVIVSVGRGFKKKEDLQLAFELAALLKGQVGCSRPIAADLKWLEESRWVGLSGKKVRPKLYLAIGISGQPQHLAGILESRIIAAINNDPSAPIFQNCDYGVVEDLYKIVPALIKRLK